MRYALLVSHENISQNYYTGKDKSMQLANLLFRMGCAAVLFTTDSKGAKYQIKDIVRTHIGSNDESHRCIY